MRACIELQGHWVTESLREIDQVKVPKSSVERETEILLQELQQLPILNM